MDTESEKFPKKLVRISKPFANTYTWYMKKRRYVQVEKENPELVWDPGPAQVDFGEADFYASDRFY